MQSTANLQLNARVNTEADVRYAERNYLDGRAYNIYSNKKYDARIAFGLADEQSPQNPQALVDRIKAGLYVLPEQWNNECDTNPQWFVHNIRWRDPKKVEDKDGYKAKCKVFEVEYQKLLDTIKIKDPTEALTELQAWETAST